MLFGGKLEYGMVGGAPLSRETDEFVNICFGTFKQAYGTTELCCGATFSEIDYYKPCNVGPPIGCSEIKLVTWEEAGYFSEDPEKPQGEIHVHGQNVCKEYFNDSSQTAESFYVDGFTKKIWFKTGDIGQKLPDGTFRIIDRKQDIIKLVHGEYVSLVRIETILMRIKFIKNCCVLPNEEKSALVALIVPNTEELHELATENKISDNLSENEKLNGLLLSHLNRYIDIAKLNKWERINKCQLVEDEWTVESGVLTPTMKIKRRKVREMYAKFL
ncbi:Long chain acyl-CoA synthetase 8 [Thelohanellus kitauei]|uniref:long-chain-fatty-acid--CoA ligase n=1 Tax=Thelohanellus kitauei TaxID=669202 RepID=A0A0C2MEA6_THEKT|nr:Long chain acyl-CoA synthetase 8 [Thelohanellus kitauei]